MAFDPDLIRALHLVPDDHRAASRDVAEPHQVFQASTVTALIDGAYDGDRVGTARD